MRTLVGFALMIGSYFPGRAALGHGSHPIIHIGHMSLNVANHVNTPLLLVGLLMFVAGAFIAISGVKE